MFKHYLTSRHFDLAGLDPTPNPLSGLENGDFTFRKLFGDEVCAGQAGDATTKYGDLLGIIRRGWRVMSAKAKAKALCGWEWTEEGSLFQ